MMLQLCTMPTAHYDNAVWVRGRWLAILSLGGVFLTMCLCYAL